MENKDKLTIGTLFMSQIIGRIVKAALRKNDINLKHFTLKELEVTHDQDNTVGVSLSLNAQMTEDEFLALLKKYNIL